MSSIRAPIASIRRRLLGLSILQRLVLGNSLIIILGAIVGTLYTRHLTDIAADLWVILLFATAGTSLSVVTNFLIIRASLKPLHDLRRRVDRLQAGATNPDFRILEDGDPDISQLSAALDHLVNQLDERNQQLRLLSERAINAQEEERRRIALSLHDDTGQALSTLIINLERLENRLPQEPDAIRFRLEASRKLATSALEELRKIVYDLRPTILDDLGLVSAIRWYARTNLEPSGIQVEIQAPREDIQLPPQLHITLFRIAQEAVNNILKHAGAKRVWVEILVDAEQACLEIEDDGVGFDVSRISEGALRLRHLGLLGIQERTELVRGEVVVESEPGRGTRLRVSAPLQ